MSIVKVEGFLVICGGRRSGKNILRQKSVWNWVVSDAEDRRVFVTLAKELKKDRYSRRRRFLLSPVQSSVGRRPPSLSLSLSSQIMFRLVQEEEESGRNLRLPVQTVLSGRNKSDREENIG